jgi:heme/copper-type cytochrome/quinol oxidase subunit 4
MIALQILISILYSMFGSLPRQPINMNSVLTTIFFAFLVVAGKWVITKALDSSMAILEI